MALWCSYGGPQQHNRPYRGRGANRGYSNTWRGDGGRGSSRARGSYRGRGNYNQNGYQANYRGRGNYSQYNNRGYQHQNDNNNRRGNYHPHSANVAERVIEEPRQQNQQQQQQQQPRQEEANLIDLFR